MIAEKLMDFVAYENDDVYKTYWKFSKNGGVTIVCNEEDKFIGIIGKKDWEKHLHSMTKNSEMSIRGICNQNCITIGTENMYEDARNIYAEKNIEFIPVVDTEGNLLDLFTRRRAFYRWYFENNKLDKMNYAKMVWSSAVQGKALGYKAISVIEFGVAAGNGLLALKFHAREISRLLGIEIQVYGFDTGEGLPSYAVNYLDMPFQWQQGLFQMDFSELSHKLENAKLVIGDINETIVTFFEEYNPAPIGMVAVDVDLYSSTLPILKMFEETKMDYFVPRIYMYFDDILGGYECLGQNMAIKDFNSRNKGKVCISPEGTESGIAWLHGNNKLRYYDDNIKICHMFTHPNYNKFIRKGEDNIIINNGARTL